MPFGLRWSVVSLLTTLCLAQAPAPVKQVSSQVNSNYGRLPLTFEANQGQLQPQAKFLSRGKGYTAVLTAGGITLSLRPSRPLASSTPKSAAATQSRALRNTTLQFNLIGASPNPQVVGEDPQPGRVNYFIGNDRTKWRTNIPTYARVRYKQVYPGIDLLYYGNHRQLEYDFALAPGADPSHIHFEIKGARNVALDAEGDLVIKTGAGQLHFKSPAVYQESNGSRTALSGGYVLESPTRIGFRLGAFDANQPLVIDPVLAYSTYLGGTADDSPSAIAVDASGAVYIAGYTDSGDFPLATVGALAPGNDHVFVAKLDATGSNLIYADYLGGNNQEFSYGITLDSANEVYVTGATGSSNFPTVNAYQPSYPGGFNTFVSKISTDGSSLLYSTYLGGTGSDVPAGIALDAMSNILVAGYTTSQNFPVSNAFQSTEEPNGGGLYGNYGFLTKFTPDGSSLVYSTFLGGGSMVPYNCGGTPCWGNPTNNLSGMAMDAAGNAYVVGTTNTYDFPVTPGTFQTSDSTTTNGFVGFVSKFNSSGGLSYSTYFYDTAGYTQVQTVAIDGAGSAYITGSAFGDNTFPLTSTTICDPAVSGSACSYVFVTKLAPDATSLVYSTFLGPNNYASPAAIALDANNDAYVLASTSSNTFSPVNGMESYGGGEDVLLAEIDPLGGSQLFATYLGGSSDEIAAAMTLDSTGNIYLTGTTTSTDLPTTQGAFQLQLGGNSDAFLMKINNASAAAVSLNPWSLEYTVQPLASSSPAQQVLLRNMGSSTLTIGSISANGDFAETDNCGTSVPASGSCSLSVTFTPTAVGSRTGSISIQDDAAGSPHLLSLSGTASGPVVVLTPASLTFASTQLGATSSAQTVSLSNQGTLSLSIGSIQINGDFAQTNHCAATLTAGSSCTLSVTFRPTVAGSRSGAITIADNAAPTSQTVLLSGTGAGQPGTALSSTTLTFSSSPIGTASTTQTVTLSNPGAVGLSISNIQISGDFSQTNNCSATLAAGSSCTFNVAFTATTTGTRSGKLTITDNASASPQSVTLSGTGVDFKLAGSPSSSSVNPGAAATYSLTVTPLAGSFSSAVKLSCTGAPANSTCSVSPTSVTPGSKAASVTLTVTTTSPSSAAVRPVTGQGSSRFAMWWGFQGFGVFGMLALTSERKRKRISSLIVVALFVGLLMMTACAGGTGIVSQGSGTAAGTYTVTVAGSSGSLQHSLPVTLVVK
jgi:hypothetical protein